METTRTNLNSQVRSKSLWESFMLTSTGRKQMKLTVCFRGLSLKRWHYHVSRLGTQRTKRGHCLHWALILATSRDCSDWLPFLSFYCSQSVYLFLIAPMWRLLFIVLSLQTSRFSAIRCRGGQTLFVMWAGWNWEWASSLALLSCQWQWVVLGWMIMKEIGEREQNVLLKSELQHNFIMKNN